MDPAFTNHFGPLADSYAQYRPSYPPALFDWLAQKAPARDLVWDCACGSGQASLGLAERFKHVHATDASAQQISQAVAHPNVTYQLASAQNSGLADATVDLITVAQALHWFDLPAFLAEARRVLRPDGVFAVWCYGGHTVADQDVNAVLQHFYRVVVGPYWPAERSHVEDGYRNIVLPIQEFPDPQIAMSAQWTLPQIVGYMGSWSATARYQAAHSHSPLPALLAELAPLWGDPTRTRTVTWDFALRAGTF